MNSLSAIEGEKRFLSAWHKPVVVAFLAIQIRWRLSLDRQEFKNLCRQQTSRLLAYFVTHGVDFHRAQDLVQETFIVFWEREHRVADGKAEAFLFGIARNLLLAHWRTDGRSTRTVALTGEPDGQAAIMPREHAPDVLAVAEEDAAKLRDAIGQLSPRLGEVMRLVYLEGHSRKEAAQAMGVATNTVYKFEKRAVSRLKKMLGKQRER